MYLIVVIYTRLKCSMIKVKLKLLNLQFKIRSVASFLYLKIQTYFVYSEDKLMKDLQVPLSPP